MTDIDRGYYEGLIAEWKQAASVEAGLRREFLARAERAEEVLRAVNEIDAHGYAVAPMNYALRRRIEAVLAAVGNEQ